VRSEADALWKTTLRIFVLEFGDFSPLFYGGILWILVRPGRTWLRLAGLLPADVEFCDEFINCCVFNLLFIPQPTWTTWSALVVSFIFPLSPQPPTHPLNLPIR